jgi:heat shock protein HslJ
MTRMAGPPQRMQLEQRFAQSLQRGGQVRIDGDTLEVRNDDGSGLRFERVE